MFCHFTSHSIYTKFGSWGIKEYMDDDQSPKYTGMQNCVFSYNSDISNSVIDKNKEEKHIIQIYPNPVSTSAVIELPSSKPHTLHIYDMSGKTVRTIVNIRTNKITINKEDLTPGIYISRLTSTNKTDKFKLVIK